MDAYSLGYASAVVAVVVLVAWLIIRAIYKTVKFNIIKKKLGPEAAQLYWDAKKKSRK